MSRLGIEPLITPEYGSPQRTRVISVDGSILEFPFEVEVKKLAYEDYEAYLQLPEDVKSFFQMDKLPARAENPVYAIGHLFFNVLEMTRQDLAQISKSKITENERLGRDYLVNLLRTK